jgi:Heterokaryon incompatibility protein (HET)
MGQLETAIKLLHPSRYGYTPLPSERSIRLAQILEETPCGIPQCRLTTISLDNGPSFIALSYTWGTPTQASERNVTADRCYRILCNGSSLAVTQNLFNFLKRARLGGPTNWPTPDDRIWIDAISINQDDLDERSSQVMLMADIFRSASTVIVWLGEQETETPLAIELLGPLTAAPPDKLDDLKKLQIDDPRMLEVLGECGGSITHWRALKRMFSRTWFSRIWVVQEISFAENIVILCGSFFLSWEGCIAACEFLSYSVLSDLQLSEIPYTGWHMEVLGAFRASNSSDLLTVLRETRAFGASDPRDKIYAVLGLASLGPTLLSAAQIIRQDYKLTSAEVFLDVASSFVRESDDLSFLTEVEDPQHREVTGIPSWVPDFSSTHGPSIYHQSLAFKADGGLKKSVHSLSNPHLLGTSAYRLGEVVYAGYLGANEPFIEYFPRMLMPLFELSPTYLTGEDRLEVLWRTMIQNGLNWVSPAAADTAQEFRNWILLNIVLTVKQDDKSTNQQELLDQAMAHLENYSKIDPTGILPTPQDVYAAAAELSDHIRRQSLADTSPGVKYGHELKFYQHMRLFRTNNGLLGLGQPSMQTGDSLWIIPGVSVPMVLRSASADDRFTVLGPAYVHGIMYGEALQRRQLSSRSIILE